MLATMQLIGAIAQQKKALDRCAPEGDAARVTWSMKGGKTSGVTATDAKNKKVDKCVAKAAAKITSGLTGTCTALFQYGKAAGATAAYEKKFGPQ